MKKLLLVAAAALLPALASAQTTDPAAVTPGIANSKHNFSTNTSAQSADGQICKYCHTPHHAQTTRGIWNHTKTTATYSYSDNAAAKSWAGTPLMTTMNPSQYSATCLSCHDGTVALGDLTNAGGGVAGVANFTGSNVTANKLSGGPAYFGTDLKGNHPIGVPYAGQTYYGRASAVPANQIGTMGGYWPQVSGMTQAPAVAGDTQPISLARDSSVSGTGAAPTFGVECSTCHNPHNSEGFNYMLRVTTNQSALCRSCHMK
jgi:predicted CXXCH cytochrome family protein